MSVYTIDNHAGPHYDPPNHIIKGGASVESAPLDKFFGKSRVLDFRSKSTGEPLLKSDFDGAGIQPGEIVIAFVGYDAPTDPDAFPSYTYLSGEMEEGKTGSENIAPEHYAFLSRDIPAIEGLVNLERLVGEEEVVFVGFPLKFENGDGGPMRAAALVY
jgi:kynurenine formamidase